MNRIFTILILTGTIFSGAQAALTIDVQNKSDGQIQLIPDQLAQKSLDSISTKNPFAQVILDQAAQVAKDQMQQGLEAATTLSYGPGESGSTVLGFCPRIMKVKKITGTGAGTELSFKIYNCTYFKLDITNAPNGFSLNITRPAQNP